MIPPVHASPGFPLQLHNADVKSPSAAVVLVLAVLVWAGVWGVQLMTASSLVPGFEPDPSGYWYVYATLSSALAILLYVAYVSLRVKIHSLMLRRTRRARLSASEQAEQYLLRREIRDRNRPIKGTGGPVPRHWIKYLNERRFED